MFEIDLQRSEKTSGLVEETPRDVAGDLFPLLPVFGVLALVFVGLWFIGRAFDSRIALRRDEVAKLEAAVNHSRQELAEISGRRHALVAVGPQDIYWSDQLRLLAEKLPDKAWLTQIHVVTAGGEKGPDGKPTPVVLQGLAVEGGVLSNPSEGNLDIVGKFVEALQGDPRFQRTFAGVRLESVKRSSDPLALLFQLTLSFKS